MGPWQDTFLVLVCKSPSRATGGGLTCMLTAEGTALHVHSVLS